MTNKKDTKDKNMTDNKVIEKNQREKIKKVCKIRCILAIILVVVYIAIIYGINRDRDNFFVSSDNAKTCYEVAKVQKVKEKNLKKDSKSDGIKKGSTKLELKVLTGRYKDEKYTVTNYYSAMFNVDVKKGDKVTVRIDVRADGGVDVSIYNYYRVVTIAIVVALFALTLILIGGKKGLKALIGLAFTLINIIGVLLPLTLDGASPVVVTLLVVLLSTVVSFILLDGISRKTIISTVGTLAGILVGTIFALLSAKLMSVTTYQMDEAEQLLLTMSTSKLQPRNLLFCGIMISCMGAVMDVAMSIASAVEELYVVNNSLTVKELYKSGMNIGRDAMGTMANTLVLAFAGNSLNMLVLIFSYGVTFTQLVNTDFIALEIIKAVSGSIGIIIAVPIVALIASYMVKNVNSKEKY